MITMGVVSLADQRVRGVEIVADPVALLEVTLLLLVGVEVLHADVEPAPVTGRLLHRHLGLLLPGEGEEAGRLGEGPVDEVLADPVAGQVGEADVPERAGQLQRRPLALGRVAGPEGGEVDDGNLLDRDALAAQRRRDLWGHGATPMLGSMNSLV
jgi:hypothetical protein